MAQTTLKMCSMTADESDLFQQHTKKWLEEVIETHLRKVEPSCPVPVSFLSATTTSGVDKRNSTELQIEAAAPKVTVIEFKTEILLENPKRPFPRQLPMLKIMIRYQTASGSSITTDHLIVKMLDDEDVQGSDAEAEDNFGKRELNFYMKAIPDLQAWAASRGRKVRFSIPKCYYGKYIEQNTDSRIALRTSESTTEKEETLFLNARSTLVFEDLSENGFTHAYAKDGLKRELLRTALKEIAVIHSVSWAFQHVTGENLGQKYNLCEATAEFVEGLVEDIEESFPNLADYLNTDAVPDGKDLLRRLENLKARASIVLQSLLTPPDPSRVPSCFIHMDFWDQNMMFKDTCGGIAVECRFLDWQNIVIGSPTLDIAAILFTSVTAMHRSFNTTALLEFYWKHFTDTATSLKVPVPYTFDSLKEEYQKSKLFPLLIMLGSIGNILDNDESTEKFIQIAKELAEAKLIT